MVIVVNKYSISLRKLLSIARAASAQAVIALALVVTAPAEAQTSVSSNGITGPANAAFRAGLWWDPALSGTGWEINNSGDAVFGIWYTYDENSNPVWFTTQGFLTDGRFEGDLLSFTWDYDKGKVNEPTVAGNVNIQFLNPQLAEIQWRLGEQQDTAHPAPIHFLGKPRIG